MTRGRISQVLAVLRLEIRKTFFARRGLWIYLLALAPLVVIGGHSFEVKRREVRRRELAAEYPGITLQRMRAVREGMSREEVVKLLAEPNRPVKFTRRGRGGVRHDRELMRFSDGGSEIFVDFEDGRVRSRSIRAQCDFTQESKVFAGIFQFFFVRLCIFFGCVFVFINSFRGEMLDKSLHYYFLAPVRREVVVIGKYLAGLIATAVIFGASVCAQMYFWFRHFPAGSLDEYLAGGGWNHVWSYLGVTVLACVGYGAVFLAAGVLVRNPLVPAVSMLLWESINPILPAALAQISVIHYLKSLCPVEVPVDPGIPAALAILVVNGNPASAWASIGGLLLLSALVLFAASWRSRRLEIAYGAE